MLYNEKIYSQSLNSGVQLKYTAKQRKFNTYSLCSNYQVDIRGKNSLSH